MKEMNKQTKWQRMGPRRHLHQQHIVNFLFDHYIKKLHDHYNDTIINRYKNSGISPEAMIITNELLIKAKNSPKII